MASTAFTTSDMARRRKEMLTASRAGRSFVRDTDGTLFTLALTSDIAASDELADLGAALAALVASLDTEAPNAGSLGRVAFVAPWPIERRKVLANDLAEALAFAHSLHDPTPARLILDAARPRSVNPHFDGRLALESLSAETRDRIDRHRQLHPHSSR